MLRRPDEPTRSGMYRWYGWLVALRPRFLRLASIFPAPASSLITFRAVSLYAISMPATTLAILIGLAMEGERFSMLGAGIVLMIEVVRALGVVVTLWAFAVALIAFRMLAWSSKLDEQVPWSLLTFLATFTFLVWPVLNSHYGRFVIPLVWILEYGAGETIVEVRTWRIGWSFRRRWPMLWTLIDNTTANVQASFGGGISALFARSKALPRPVLNHPATSPIMEFEYGAVTFWVHAPNGQRLDQLVQLERTIVENFDAITSCVVSEPPPGSSWARMRIGIIHDDSILEGVEVDMDHELQLVDDFDEDDNIELGGVA